MKIKFIANRPWLNKSTKTKPSPAIKNIPEWYRNASRYLKNNDGVEIIGQDGGKVPAWKSCPAIYDILGTGYVLETPCDITFYYSNNVLDVKIHPRYAEFVQKRSEMPDFMQPDGYRKEHFAWWPDWGIKTPDGYSVLWSQPFNRFDLPFLNTTGIVDNDKVNLSGTVPFFIKDGWEGTIPQGTPYLQLLPFKRDDWEKEYEYPDELVMFNDNMVNLTKFRVPNGGVYLNEVWSRRKYL
jgi:hypothetical protein